MQGVSGVCFKAHVPASAFARGLFFSCSSRFDRASRHRRPRVGGP
jgi:hypothetical protein